MEGQKSKSGASRGGGSGVDAGLCIEVSRNQLEVIQSRLSPHRFTVLVTQ